MTRAIHSSGPPTYFGGLPLRLEGQVRLAGLLDSLQQLSTALEAGLGPLPAKLEPRALVNELEQVLADHCRGAEDYLKTVAVARRDLLPAVVDMRTDHLDWSVTLADLRVLAADEGQWVELPRRIAMLLEALALHRENEAELVREAVLGVKVA